MKKEKKVLTEAQVEKRKELFDFLKGLIFPTALIAVIALAIFLVIKFVNPETEYMKVDPYAPDEELTEPIVLESDGLIFTMDPLTTHFTVEQKSNGKVWSSYIEDAASDEMALESEKGKMSSNLVLSYAIVTGLETVYDSYTYSVKNNIYHVEKDGDTVKVFYSMGSVEKEYIIPTIIKAADFEAYLEKFDSGVKDTAKDAYKKYDIDNLKSGDNKDDVLEQFPIAAKEVIYVLRDTTKEARKEKLEAAFSAAGYTYDDYLADMELGTVEKKNDKPVFNVEMDFRLEGNDMVVEIPFSSLKYNPSMPIYTLSPLPYFGAASREDEGYMFVPEGGGALINYNNGKTSQSDYYANVYGWDMGLRRKFVIHNTRAYFGVFGQSRDDSSYICILEDGASYASVRAFISGRQNTYNFTNALYSICAREQYDIGDIANSDVYAYSTKLPQDESIVQRYRFVDSPDYVDMAYAYRDYLETEYGQYMTLNDYTEAPLTVELVGAIDKIQQVMGVPVSRPLKLTSFNEASDIITDLSSQDVGHLSVKLTGWCNGGVSQKLLKRVTLVAALGTQRDLKNLCKTAKDNGVDLYLDGITQYEHNSNIFNGFFSYRDAARLLTRERAEQFNFSHVTYKAREGFKSYYLLHTPLAMRMADNLVKQAVKYGTGVSFQDIGMDLSSDYYRKDPHSRENTKVLNTDLLKTLDDKNTKLMVNMGNDYAVPYADVVTNMDLKGSGYTVLDEEVPFYQIAVHGYVNYTGYPVNISGNDEEEVLMSAEYGAGLNFTLMSESSFTLQKTLYPEYYGSEYASWRDRVLSICTRYNRELGHTFNQEMTGHEILSPYVRCTTYADGTKVYVNYGFAEDYTAEDGTVVKARDYTVVR